jgi:2-amino-4-hydroxy-6-hydroxymethyldihydropteridine diphosphokinase
MRAIIGLGSNLGDRLGHLQSAVKRIARFAKVEAASHVYETKPVGPPQGDYLNAAILIRYEGASGRAPTLDTAAIDLLDSLQAVETALGRVRDVRWGPRTLDLDILWVEGLAMESERLVVPHPRLVERPFALRPLVDVMPDAVDPVSLLPYTRLFDAETAFLRPTTFDLFGAS